MKTSDFSKYDPALARAIKHALTRIYAELDVWLPLSAPQIKGWLTYLAGSKQPANYYLRHGDLPMFLFPQFLEQSLGVAPDLPFQSDRVYSTINGFYWIRLLDNVTDHHALEEIALLPALAFFQDRFHSPYQSYFPADHPFWDTFRQLWFHSADVTLRDLQAETIDRETFVQVAAQKTCAVKIPLAAISYKSNHPERLAPWSAFFDVYGCWHQMSNDLFHWHADWELETATYFLSEAARQKRPTESIPGWVIREGLTWGLTQLNDWMRQARALTRPLHSPELSRYLNYRDAKLKNQAREMRTALRAASKLGSLFFETP